MSYVKPLQSMFYGGIAGLLGSVVIGYFFRATKKIAPAPPKDAFTPPEPEQRSEQPTQTVARRVVDDLMERGPLSGEAREKSGETVQRAFGVAWGAAYGLIRESMPRLGGLGATFGFGSLVWAISNGVILPAFRLSGWPQRYPPRNHLYLWAAHVPYAATVWATYELLRRRAWATLGGTLVAWRKIQRIPSPVRPPLGRVARGVARVHFMRRMLGAAREELRAG